MSVFWNGRRVLITGHTGFKGAWLVKWLDMLGARTLGIALPPDGYGVYDKIKFTVNHKSEYVDIRNSVMLIEAVSGFEPEIIIHMAARAIVGEARKNPADTFETNLMGTVNLIEAARKTQSVGAVVIVTSDKVYENMETAIPYGEDARLGGDEPYAASKACAELAVMAYRNAVLPPSVGIATARAANVYGGGDLHYDRLIPYLIRARIEKIAAEIRNPGAVRPWQHVLSPLHGYLLLAEALYNNPGEFSEGFNFGPPEEELYTVREIAAMISGDVRVGTGSGFKEAGLLRIDSAKSRERLGWKHIMDINSGLASTVEFYRAMYTGSDVTELMERAMDYLVRQ